MKQYSSNKSQKYNKIFGIIDREKKSGDVIISILRVLESKRDVEAAESFIIVFCLYLNYPFLLENYSN